MYYKTCLAKILWYLWICMDDCYFCNMLVIVVECVESVQLRLWIFDILLPVIFDSRLHHHHCHCRQTWCCCWLSKEFKCCNWVTNKWFCNKLVVVRKQCKVTETKQETEKLYSCMNFDQRKLTLKQHHCKIHCSSERLRSHQQQLIMHA